MKNTFQKALIAGFCIILLNYNQLAVFSGFNQMLLSIVLGAFGAILGALIYQFFSKKNALIKYLFVSGLCIILICGAVFLPKNEPEPISGVNIYANLIAAVETDAKERMSKPIDTNALKIPKLSPEQYSKLITCEICGYKAVQPDSDYCYNCFNNIFDSKYIKNKNEWLRNEQLFWFSPDNKNDTIQFFIPQIEDGFKKDLKWKPTVTKKEVLEYRMKND